MVRHRHASGPGERLQAEHAEAEFLAGWIALRFLNESKTAENHFKRLYDSVSYPVSLSRGAYWLGRATEASGKPEEAKKWYTSASRFPTTYYGQLATANTPRRTANDPTATSD